MAGQYISDYYYSSSAAAIYIPEHKLWKYLEMFHPNQWTIKDSWVYPPMKCTDWQWKISFSQDEEETMKYTMHFIFWFGWNFLRYFHIAHVLAGYRCHQVTVLLECFLRYIEFWINFLSISSIRCILYS